MCEWKVGALNMIICCVSLSLPLLPTNQWLLTGFPVYSVLVHVLSESGTSDRASLAFQNAILYYLHCGDLCMHACTYIFMCVYGLVHVCVRVCIYLLWYNASSQFESLHTKWQFGRNGYSNRYSIAMYYGSI